MSEEMQHPLDPYGIAAFAARQGIPDAAAAAEAWASLTPEGREKWRMIADAVLMLRDMAAPQPAPAIISGDAVEQLAAVADLAATWAEPDRPGTNLTHDESVEQHVYQECARSLLAAIGGAQ